MKNFKIIAAILFVLFIFLELFVFMRDDVKTSDKPIVSVSTFVLYDAVRAIAGDSVVLKNILPFGVDPHSFELTPKTMASIERSALVIYSGAGLEPWIDKIVFQTKVLNMSQFVNLRKIGKIEQEKHHHKHHSEEGEAIDPHYWLDFENMKIVAKKITEALIEILPENAKDFTLRRDLYLKSIDKLEKDYEKKLAACSVHHLILNHNSFGYLADKYNFHAESLTGLSPEASPSPSDIKRILQEIKKDGVETIFYEHFVNARVIESIAKDANIKIEVIQTLGNITAKQANKQVTYEELMQENLKKIAEAMYCN